MVDMDFEQQASEAVARAMRVAPAEVRAAVEDDFAAGETLTVLIELVERAPGAVDRDAVDLLDAELASLPDGPHRRIGSEAVARYRATYAA